MNYDLLFLDFDGTLKQEPNPISDANKKAILKAIRAGKKISIATGRNKDLILRTVKELKLNEFGPAYTVTLNGAHIIENSGGHTLKTVPIPLDLTRFLFEKACEYGISCHVYTEDPVYFNYKNNQFIWYQKEGCDCRLIELSRGDLGVSKEPLKCLLYSRNKKELEQFREMAEAATSGILNAEFSSNTQLEYTSVNASKGLGMEYVCSLFNKPLSSAIALGDGENDISMLRMAGLGIAMKNALDTVKAAADTVTERTCMEDGVKEIIEEYLLSQGLRDQSL